MRILIVTDAWLPQVNGVVRTLRETARVLEARRHKVAFLTAEGRCTWPVPSYPEIRVGFMTAAEAGRRIRSLEPDVIYIATEGPIGWAARNWCTRTTVPFATGFHTKLADYAALRLPLPGVAAAAWSLLRRFHAPSCAVLAPTPSIARELAARGFTNVRNWSRGIDRVTFRPLGRDALDLPRPILLFAGRLAPEKNVEAFLSLDLPGTKVLVGDGPSRDMLARKYPSAVFTGYKFGDDYVKALSAADVFVFPSRTDTFGLVMVEAMACGTPVAAYEMPSPVDVVKEGRSGALDCDLGQAVRRALELNRDIVRRESLAFSWETATDLFERVLPAIDWAAAGRPLTTSPAPFPLR